MGVKGLIIDMDGVLWAERQPLVDLTALFDRINRLGLRYRLATNNSSRTPAQFQRELAELGANIPVENILTSAIATAHYLRKALPANAGLFVMGETGLLDALSDAGFRLGADDPQAVVIGIDRELTYEKLKTAALLIRAGLPFYATNGDRTLPTPYGLVPGAGAQLAFLEATTEVAPFVIGKPQPMMMHFAMHAMGTSSAETLCIGDRVETDILGGQNAGCLTALVLSGVTSPERARAWQPAPTLIAADISAVLDQLEAGTLS